MPEVVLHPSVAERFTRCAPGLTGWRGGRCARTCGSSAGVSCRSCIRRICRCRASAPRQPYGPAQIAGYFALADAQPARERRMRAAGLVCLGAGAGLIRGDLREVRGTDVACRSGGVIVSVRGARPRTVPVLARYHARLLAAAAVRRDRADLRRRRSGPPEPDEPADQGPGRRGGLPRLDTSRLRATWLADCAELLGLATFMHAAGISCSQRLGDLIAGLEPGSEDEAVRLLGAARRP